jgi:hypothetical protein
VRSENIEELVLSFSASKDDNVEHRLCKLCIERNKIAPAQRKEERRFVAVRLENIMILNLYIF